MTLDYAAALSRARHLAATGRHLLGLAGMPGSGKSILAQRLVQDLNGLAVCVPLDGFHLTNVELDRLGRRQRKGAPETFNAAGYCHLLSCLRRQRPDELITAPAFDRVREETAAAAITVPAGAPLIITEGNYLLLPGRDFGRVVDLLDEAWYVDCPEPERVRRLIARHEAFGKTPAEASRWALGSDQDNAELIGSHRQRADHTVCA